MWGYVPVSLIYIQLSSFPSTTYWRGCLFSIVYSCLLCHRLVDYRCVGLILGFLSCSTDLYFCLCATTIRFWWLLLCSVVWSQGAWFFQLHFSLSGYLWLFWVFCASKQTLKYFVRVLWKMPTFWRVFIRNGCWILSKALPASIEKIIWFLFFSLLMWCITLIDLWI